jgi:amino acid transporter
MRFGKKWCLQELKQRACMQQKNNNIKNTASNGSLGTFSGVFTPSILTILGIILFLRMGYVVGNAGLGNTLVIIGLANVISLLTTFSLSAIATNLKVKKGGDYYLISRTLGLEFGGSIGLVLFFAQSVSIGFYCIGFGEALTHLIPDASTMLPQIIAAAAVLFLFVFAWMGTDWATKFQYVVMTILVIALVSFFVGGFSKWDNAMLMKNMAKPEFAPDFWILFAIFFPAVTGFTQGVSMSGDLKDPGKSLPAGTFIAVGISIVIYFGAAIVFASAMPASILAKNYGAMKQISAFGFLIDAGVIAATLSSAMASFLGAPRILQSLASDRIFPFLLPFAKGSGAFQNPRRGVMAACVIACATISLGKLNLIAPVVSMFFLISYGLLNYATYFEAKAASPSFRPTFKLFHRRMSLLGCLACLGAMLSINLAAGAFAIAVLFAIYQYLKRTSAPARWADGRRSYYFQRVRENLLAAASAPHHPRDWRPQILAFSKDADKRNKMLHFASWLEGGSGITTAVELLEGEGLKMLKQKSEAEEKLRKQIMDQGLNVFPLVLIAPNFRAGIHAMVQSFGIGPIKANIVLFNWIDTTTPRKIQVVGEAWYTANIRAVFRFGCNIILLDAKETAWTDISNTSSEKKYIDVWWQDDSSSRLMLLLAYLMTRSQAWEEAKIRLFAARNENYSEKDLEELEKTLQEVRIEGEPEIVSNMSTETIINKSSGSSIVFLPFRIKGNKIILPFGNQLKELMPHLPNVALVLAAEDIDLEAEPEEGKIGELAAALDAFSDAEKNAQKIKEESDKATKEAKKKAEELETAISSGSTEDLMIKVKTTIDAKQQAEKALRRTATAEAKVENAAKNAEALGADLHSKDKPNSSTPKAENT